MGRSGLQRLLRPSSIALVGGRHLAAPIRTCRRAGFAGELSVVNPVRDEIGGIATVPDVTELPAPPDAALVALSPERSIEAVRALSGAGAGGAVVMTSGFREIGPAGARLERALVEAAGDMALLGPNCLGVLNQADGAAVFGDDVLARRVDGPCAAIVSQSGAFLIGIACVEKAFPLGYAISVGNQAQTDHAACIEALLDDERVRAIGLYIEGIDDAGPLARAAWRAAGRGVPIVALKGGDGELGSEVARSHTAALVVERVVWQAFAERYGIVEVSSVKALVETLKLLTLGGVPRGDRATIVSFSGGINGQVARHAAGTGLALPPPAPARARALRQRLPETIAVSNPLDLNLPYTSSSGLSLADEAAIVETIVDLAADVSDQVTFILDIPPAGPANLDMPWLPAIRAMETVRARLGLPCSVASILPEGLEPHLREDLMSRGVASLCGFSEAMEAMGIAARLAGRETGGGPVPALAPRSASGTATALDEAAGKALLAEYGIVSPRRIEAAPARAGAAARTIGGRVALKLLNGQVLHKAAVGGVALDVHPGDVDARLAAMSVALAGNGLALDRVLVEAMIPGAAREIILGVRRVPAMGLAMVLGSGGLNVESQGDAVTLLLPLDRRALRGALSGLGLADVPSVRSAAEGLAAFALDNSERLEAVEVNPLILTDAGEAIAADAVVQFITPEGDPT